MEILIRFDVDNADFVGDGDWESGHVNSFYDAVGEVLMQAREKVVEQRRRSHKSRECVCTHPEEADVLRDRNGNRIGTVKVVP